MVSLRDLGARNAVWVLAHMGRAGKPIGMEEFTEVSDLTDTTARKLLLDLVQFGLVAYETVPIRGAAKHYEISLTALGQEVAEHLAAADDVLQAARGAAKARARR